MIHIRYLQEEDKPFWFGLDKHITETEYDRKVRDGMGYVLLEEDKPVGLLRYNLFWDSIPFCTMLFVDGKFQKKGYGTMLLQYWEKEMKAKGHGMVMTSTQSDEEAQHFYRKAGYQDAGGMVLTVPGYEQPMELFFVKAILNGEGNTAS